LTRPESDRRTFQEHTGLQPLYLARIEDLRHGDLVWCKPPQTRGQRRKVVELLFSVLPGISACHDQKTSFFTSRTHITAEEHVKNVCYRICYRTRQHEPGQEARKHVSEREELGNPPLFGTARDEPGRLRSNFKTGALNRSATHPDQ
jgi:hypothetical protein